MVDNSDFPDKLVLLNSINAIGATKTLDVLEWNIYDPDLSRKAMNGYTFWLETAQFVNLVYPINQYNNVLSFVTSGTTYSVTLPQNNYTGTSIATELATLLNALSIGTWTVTFDTVLQVLTFATTGSPFIFLDLTSNANYNALHIALGIYIDGLSYTTYICPDPVYLLGTKAVDLVSNLETGVYSSTGVSNWLGRISISSGFGQIVYFYNYQSNGVVIRQQEITKIQIQLRDDYGNLFVLPRNANFAIGFWLKPIMGIVT